MASLESLRQMRSCGTSALTPIRCEARRMVYASALAHLDRRQLLIGTGSASILPTLQSILPGSVQAFEIQEVLAQAFPPPPSPVLFPRKALDQRFAVLLMRSGYEAVDALDFMPMDKFQVSFWKLRQAEQEGYGLQYLPLKVRKGDLTDPLYFDFISFAQYAVIGREMPKGQVVFQEFCEECPDGGKRLVRRDPALADNALLPPAFNDMVGDFLFTGLRDGFRGEQFGGPQALPPSSSLQELLGGVQRILDIMVDRGYALKAEISDVVDAEGETSFKVRVQGPVNLWALESLSFRRNPVLNTYDSLAVASFLRASGHPPSKIQLAMNDTGVVHTFTLV